MRFFLQFLFWTFVGSTYALLLACWRFYVYWHACGGREVLTAMGFGGLTGQRRPPHSAPPPSHIIANWCLPAPDITTVFLYAGSTVMAIFFACFTAAMAYDQVEGMTTNTTAIESMKGWEEEDRSLTAGLTDYCGGPPGWGWLLPVALSPDSPAYFSGEVADPDEYEPRDPLIQRHFRRIEAQLAAASAAQKPAARAAAAATANGATTTKHQSAISSSTAASAAAAKRSRGSSETGGGTVAAGGTQKQQQQQQHLRPPAPSQSSHGSKGTAAPPAPAAAVEAAAAPAAAGKAAAATAPAATHHAASDDAHAPPHSRYIIEDAAGVMESVPGCVRPPHADAATTAAIAEAEEEASLTNSYSLDRDDEDEDGGAHAASAEEGIPAGAVEHGGDVNDLNGADAGGSAPVTVAAGTRRRKARRDT